MNTDKDADELKKDIDEILEAFFHSMKAVYRDDEWQVRMIGIDKRTASAKIKKLLQSERNKTLEMVRDALPEKRKTVKDYQGSTGMGWLSSEAEPYNQALDDISANLSKLEELLK